MTGVKMTQMTFGQWIAKCTRNAQSFTSICETKSILADTPIQNGRFVDKGYGKVTYEGTVNGEEVYDIVGFSHQIVVSK